MKNKELARLFNEWADYLEVHDGNPFKVRTYKNAYILLRRQTDDLIDLSFEKLVKIPGLGKGIASAIVGLRESGSIAELEELRSQTPDGVQEMFKIRGLGAKKIKLLWKEHGFEQLSDLLQACEENRLIQIKGFGPKMQQTIKEGIEFFRASEGKYLLSDGHDVANQVIEAFQAYDILLYKSGDLLLWEEIVDRLELITDAWVEEIEELGLVDIIQVEDQVIQCTFEGFQFYLICGVEDPVDFLIQNYAPEDLNVEGRMMGENVSFTIASELWNVKDISIDSQERIVDHEDIRGVVHNHSTYSDGRATLHEMATACRDEGYEYLVISDHSKSAFYANGLTEKRVIAQWNEIDQWNQANPDFRIFKSIESDILADGSLDYDDEFLEGFDLVIASVHAHLNMDKDKATQRLINAIEHPATRILGHPTGRLLLGRAGYPIDFKKIIDACADNEVAIEINANPHRLDISWQWVSYAMSKNVWISINPDAHSVDGIDDIFYGVMMARKGGLSKDKCLNALDVKRFSEWIG